MKACGWIRKNNRGFTVAELAMTLAIIAILASLAIPSATNWLPNYRLRKALTDLRNNFQYARLAAVKSNCNCTITFNQAVGGITYDYVIFIDNDNDATFDAAETVIARVRWSDYNSDVRFDTTQGGGDGLDFTSVFFNSKGIPNTNGNVYLINTNGTDRRVGISPAGMISIQ